MLSRTADSKVFASSVSINSDADGLCPVLVRSAYLDSRNPVLLPRLFVAVVSTNASPLGALQRTPTVVHGETGLRKRDPPDASGDAVDVTVLVLDVHDAPIFSARELVRLHVG